MSTPEHNRPAAVPSHKERDVVREGVGDLFTGGSSLEHVVEDDEPRITLGLGDGEGNHLGKNVNASLDRRNGECSEERTAAARTRRVRVTPAQARDLSRRPKFCRRCHAEDIREARRMIEVAVGKRDILNPLRTNAERSKIMKKNVKNPAGVPEQISGRRLDEDRKAPLGVESLPLAEVVDNDRGAVHEHSSQIPVKTGGDLAESTQADRRSTLHYSAEDLENSTPIPPDPPFRAVKQLLALLGALLAGVAAGLIVPVLAGFGERGLAIGIATTALILLGIGIHDQVKDPDNRSGMRFILAGLACVFLLIVVLI